MKKLLILCLVFTSLAASAKPPCDTSFTAKMINVANKARLYYQASEVDKPQEFIEAINSFDVFTPTDLAYFDTKLSCMLNSPTEMAKVPPNMIGFLNCVVQAASTFVDCLRIGPPPSSCLHYYETNIISCGANHLVHYWD